MILGLGNDIIEIQRIKKSIERHGSHFLDRIFLPKEQEYCFQFKDSVPHFAARFSAKEAASKALGTGFGEDLSWHDVEIVNERSGKPTLLLSEKAKKRFQNPVLLLSMSHCEQYAISTVLFLQRENGSK